MKAKNVMTLLYIVVMFFVLFLTKLVAVAVSERKLQKSLFLWPLSFAIPGTSLLTVFYLALAYGQLHLPSPLALGAIYFVLLTLIDLAALKFHRAVRPLLIALLAIANLLTTACAVILPTIIILE